MGGTIPSVTTSEKIEELIKDGWDTNYGGSERWMARVRAFLAASRLQETLTEFQKIAAGNTSGYVWERSKGAMIGLLEATAVGLGPSPSVQAQGILGSSVRSIDSKKVFLVHGHDNEAKESVARFVERIGLEPIILHEQPNSGLTVVEKFEIFAAVGFAIVLLTPDDVGALASEVANLKPRARQNVILELGYFLGKLTRRRVCALYKQGVEIPSDYQGVLYVELDAQGAWRTKLAQELVEAGFSINLDALLKA
jgi:predicted nucleotide-binding protein